MSFIDLNIAEINNTPELHTVPNGTYQCLVVTPPQVIEFTGTDKKTGESYEGKRLSILLKVIRNEQGEEQSSVKLINHAVFFPRPTASKDERETANRQMGDFLKAFSIPINDAGMDADGSVGCTGWAVLAEKDSPEYGMQNNVRRFVPSN